MKDQKMSKQDKVKDEVNPMIVAIAGAVAGAGIAVAGVVLSDEKNRKKIVEAANTVKNNVTHFVEKTQKQIKDEKKIIEKRVLADRKKVKKVVASARNSVDKTTKEVNKAVKSL